MKKNALILFLLSFSLLSTFATEKSVPLIRYANNTLEYISDSKGNNILDYSYAGYEASNVEVPFVPVEIIVKPIDGDATDNLQSAIDYVAKLPLKDNGFRGAVLLKAGTYRLNGRLKLETSGIVLRGEGFGLEGTQLIAEGTSRETLLRIEGKAVELDEAETAITQTYVPVGAMQLELANANDIKEGQSIAVFHPCTKEWIEALGMSDFGGETSWWGWKPEGQFIRWDRKVVKVHENRIYLDAPITSAIDSELTKAFVRTYQDDKRINRIGIENLSITSAYDKANQKDEEHCWNGISFENVENSWVRRIKFKHLAGSAVAVYQSSAKITVEDCTSTEPISEIGGLRRQTFYTEGQQVLFLRLYAEEGVHDFATGAFMAGPSAFVECTSVNAHNFSGTVKSWASGVLFDIVNVDRQALSLKNRYINGYGAGWTAANCMIWQSTASMMECFSPPGANNWVYGAWSQFLGNAHWEYCNEHIKPRSLFFQQLASRIGIENIPENPVMLLSGEATSSPTPEQAKALMDYAMAPAMSLLDFIEKRVGENPISLEIANAKSFEKVKKKSKQKKSQPLAQSLEVNEFGWLVRGDKVLTGNRQVVPWWSGGLRPRDIERVKPAITRYVPGKQGLGYTDNLDDVIAHMKESGLIAMEQNYALWYDRRRDDHERTSRINGEVWAPFLELPFARSGEGVAWDGLSKFDLRKYNTWYWQRLKTFADKVDEEGLVLIHQNYFQHNILEAGAHWVDSPWRPTNNINDTQFPEPVPFAGDKRVFMDRHFYDETHEVRRPLHEAYIEQCFNNFANNNGVIQMLSAEYTGPLHFMEFWLDVIAGWELKTGKKELVALSATKDVQDSILKDEKRSKLVDVIDIRYWASIVDGSLWAPDGDMHMAPRQHMRIDKVGKRSFQTVYNDVLKYRIMYPQKAVINSFDQSEDKAWAIFMAGGSLAGIPKVCIDEFYTQASCSEPIPSEEEGVYMLKSNKDGYIVYLTGGKQCVLNIKGSKYNVTAIDAVTGKLLENKVELKDKEVKLTSIGGKRTVYLLVKA